jgi:hypothetical protein
MEHPLYDDDILNQNYLDLNAIVENGVNQAFSASDLHEAKGILIEVQQHFKGLKLRHNEREELYARLQAAFQVINSKIDDARLEAELETTSNYNDLKPLVDQTLDLLRHPHDSKEIWSRLIDIQTLIREKKLNREQRLELLSPVQDAFTLIKMERDEERQLFERDASANYNRLKELVNQGLKLAEETHEYKETREFLKKIQSEFKGAKMLSEQREELYSRLQTAFDILGKRLDDFFRNKKKNWETKMNFTLSRFDVDIYELQQSIKREQEFLEELLDQLEILASSGKETSGKLALEARIVSIKRGIEHKNLQASSLMIQREELKTRLEQ